MKTLSTNSRLVTTGILLFLMSPAVTTAQDAADVSSDSSGLAPIELTMLNGDPVIVTNTTYLIPGENPGERTGMLRYMALAYIAGYPDVLDHKAPALDIAKLLLNENAKNQYLDHVQYYPDDHRVWKGADEFQQQRSFRSFVEKFGPVFSDAAPEPPFDLWVIERANLGRYDFDRQGYTIYAPQISKPFEIRHDGTANARSLTNANTGVGINYINLHNTVDVPRFLPMGMDRAEELTNFIEGKDDDSVYFGAKVTVTDVFQYRNQSRPNAFRNVTMFAGGILNLRIRSLGLFADAKLTHVIHRYDTTPLNQPEESVSETVSPDQPRQEQKVSANQNTGHPYTLVQVTFTNGTSAPVQVVWVNPQGLETPYYVLQPGTSYVQSSYATHHWRFKQGDRVLGTFTVGTDANQAWTVQP